MLQVTYSVLSLLVASTSAAIDPSKLVPMSEYAKDTRTLDCWQCFAADGFFCHEKDQKSLKAITGSDDPSMGICCKPGY